MKKPLAKKASKNPETEALDSYNPRLDLEQAREAMEKKIDSLDVADIDKMILQKQLRELIDAALGVGKVGEILWRNHRVGKKARVGRTKKRDRRLDIIAELIAGKTGSNKALAREVYVEFEKCCEAEELKPYGLDRLPRYIALVK